jgi:Mn-dependent DtxR family transcriptional regulator
MSHDRVGTEEMPLTQDFLGTMLGARRSTVTVAASTLQRAGLIDYRRGHIKILNRERLEDTACECYGVVRDLHTHLIRY